MRGEPRTDLTHTMTPRPSIRFPVRRFAVLVAVSVLIAGAAAALNGGFVSLPGVGGGPLRVAVAKTHVLVDTPKHSIVERRALDQDLKTMVAHSAVLAGVMQTSPVLDRIAAQAGLPRSGLSAGAYTTDLIQESLLEPDSLRRAHDIAAKKRPYRFEVQARSSAPIIDVYVIAPTPDEAARLAKATVTGLRDYLEDFAGKQGFPRAELVELRQLGTAAGRPVQQKAPMVIAILTFVTVFTIAVVVLWSLFGAGTFDIRRRFQAVRKAGGDWPRTTRVLPWAIAGFITVLWLAPFSQIELDVPAPIDLKLDRLLLPGLVGAWLLALASGRRFGPSLNWTRIHVAAAVFLACAFLSVVLNARELTSTLEFDLPVKQLPLIVSYMSLFAIVATGVRPAEVRPFMIYSLILAVLCAFGVIWEYRFVRNLFVEWSDMILPGPFVVGAADAAAVDGLGRRMVRGPADVSLETVTMLAMALPVALVGLLGSSRWRSRLLYGIAACALVAAMFATFRKSALLAPVSVFATIAYFRRSELLKLAPLGLLLLVVVSVLSPGALGSTIAQFTRSDASSVPTVSDRVADYDAVRPDFLTHFLFGRGWGGYSHFDYRILDSEILHRTMEMGVVGLLAFVAIPVTVVLSARRLIADRRSPLSAPALIGAAGAVALLVASTLYDVLSFPHGAYIFLYMAGLTAVVVSAGRRERGAVAVVGDDEQQVPAQRSESSARQLVSSH